jgi:hypothetical protein
MQGVTELLDEPAVLRGIFGHAPIWTTANARRATANDALVWLWCERCQHQAPLACAVAVILRGPEASSDKLRAGARCTSCGRKGATLQRPGWAGNHVGFYPFPTNIADETKSAFGLDAS